jgi:ADP-heptose:LPS heptosyltransferase
MKILITAITSIGQTIVFIPTLRMLRQQLPEAVIDLVVREQASKDILERIRCSRNIDVLNPYSPGTAVHKAQLLLELRREHYDVSITAFPSNRLACNLFSIGVGARQRIATRNLVGQAETFGFLQTDVVDTNVHYHDVKQNLTLLTGLGIDILLADEDISWEVSAEEAAYAAGVLDQAGWRPDELIIGFHPGGNPQQGKLCKRWPAHYFARLGDKLCEQLGAKIVLFGGSEEIPLKEEIAANMKHQPLIPAPAPLLPTAALIRACRLFIANETGLMHTATAMGVPTVGLFGPGNPSRRAPHGRGRLVIRADLPCVSCDKYPFYQYGSPMVTCLYKGAQKGVCMQRISVEHVYDIIVRNYAHLLPPPDASTAKSSLPSYLLSLFS